MARLHVATLNLRNVADRWAERRPLLLAGMAALQPDLMGLQEVVYPVEQDRLIADAAPGRYEVFRSPAERPEYGNSILVREGFATRSVDRLPLSHGRSAARVVVELGDGPAVAFAVTHLHHVPSDEAVRDAQAAALVAWLDGGPATDALVVVGDFNAEPVEPAYARMLGAGFRSAFAEANDAEPEVTWPSGIVAPGQDTDGDPGCLDYIWLRGRVSAESAELVFHQAAAEDPTLYPSDHFGIAAIVAVEQ